MKKKVSYKLWLGYLKVYCVSVSPHTGGSVLLQTIVVLLKFTQYVRLVVKLRSAHDKMIVSVSLLALTVMAVVTDYDIVSGMMYMYEGLTKYCQGSILCPYTIEPSFHSNHYLTLHHSVVVMCCSWDGQCCWGITRRWGTSKIRWELIICWKGSIDSPTVGYSIRIQTLKHCVHTFSLHHRHWLYCKLG